MTEPMPTLYLAGPMTGLPCYNRPAFREAAAQLRGRGYTVLNPADHTLPAGKDTWANYMRVGLAQVLTADGVALLPGWSQSPGAQLEAHVAAGLGLPGHPWVDWLTGDPLMLGVCPSARVPVRCVELRRLVSDWQANGNGCALGDQRAEVWHSCASQLLTELDRLAEP